MPRSVLTGAKQHQRFQELLQGYQIPTLALEKVLDAEDVSPLFNVPACVLIAGKEAQAGKVTMSVLGGTLPTKNVKWSEAKEQLELTHKQLPPDKLFPPAVSPSPYLKQMKEGATLVPRCLWFVQTVPSPYGINRERPALETNPEVEKVAKKPWQNIHLQGEVEAQYLYATMTSRHLLPFGITSLSLVVLPLEDSPTGIRLVKKEAALAKGHSCLHGWLSQAEALWKERRKERSPVDVYSRLDYQRLLTSQHPTGYFTVLYSRMGTNLACAVMSSAAIPGVMGLAVTGFVTEWTSYFFQAKNEAEAHYLCAFLNSNHVDQAIKPYQTRGTWGERDISRTPFEVVAIPRFNPEDEKHQKLAELSKECHQKVAKLSLKGKSIGFLRNKVREYLKEKLAEIDELVKDVLS
ncbi:hypothetical protein ES703_109216 [subsurface metagenome]